MGCPHMQGWSYMQSQTIHNVCLQSESASQEYIHRYCLQCQAYLWWIQWIPHQWLYVENCICACDHLRIVCWRQQSNDASSNRTEFDGKLWYLSCSDVDCNPPIFGNCPLINVCANQICLFFHFTIPPRTCKEAKTYRAGSHYLYYIKWPEHRKIPAQQ